MQLFMHYCCNKKPQLPMLIMLYQFIFYAYLTLFVQKFLNVISSYVQYNSGLIGSPTIYISTIVDYLFCVNVHLVHRRAEMSFSRSKCIFYKPLTKCVLVCNAKMKKKRRKKSDKENKKIRAHVLKMLCSEYHICLKPFDKSALSCSTFSVSCISAGNDNAKQK